jgi:hypothetical protein
MIQDLFTALKPSGFVYSSPLPITSSNYGSFYYLKTMGFFSPSKMPYSWNLTVSIFSDWLLLLSNMHLMSLHVFPWLDSLFL